MLTHNGVAEGIEAAEPTIQRRPKLLERMREALRSRHYSQRTERTYTMWIRRFVHFHKLRHPADMGEAEINAFLSHLAVKQQVSASTQTQALSAILFLYRSVLGTQIGALNGLIRARKPKRLPVVFDRDEVRALIKQFKGDTDVRGGTTAHGMLTLAREGRGRLGKSDHRARW